MTRSLSHFAASLSLAFLLIGCETLPPDQRPLSPEQAAAKAAADEIAKAIELTKTKEQELEQALMRYREGQFAQAIVGLAPLISAPELSNTNHIRAIKFTAFSHCNQGQSLLCRVFFEKALRLDSSFQLADTEISHPVWGGEFRRAQRNTRSLSAPGR